MAKEQKLFNENLKAEMGEENYYAGILEQWGVANELANDVSNRRAELNNFYVSLMSILVGGVIFSDSITGSNIIVSVAAVVIISLIGVFCCHSWRSQIRAYRQLNKEKYAVINELEKSLPANVLGYEYYLLLNDMKSEKKSLLTVHEEAIVNTFEVALILIAIFMIASIVIK